MVTSSRCYHLAALRAEEDDPHGEIVRKVFETMRGASSDEQEVPSLASITVPVVNEYASATDDHVHLVLLVRCLDVRSDGK